MPPLTPLAEIAGPAGPAIPAGWVGALAVVLVAVLGFVGRRMTDRDARTGRSATAVETLTEAAVRIAQQAAQERLNAVQERIEAVRLAEDYQEQVLAARREARRWRGLFDESLAYIDLIIAAMSRDAPTTTVPARPPELDQT